MLTRQHGPFSVFPYVKTGSHGAVKGFSGSPVSWLPFIDSQLTMTGNRKVGSIDLLK